MMNLKTITAITMIRDLTERTVTIAPSFVTVRKGRGRG